MKLIIKGFIVTLSCITLSVLVVAGMVYVSNTFGFAVLAALLNLIIMFIVIWVVYVKTEIRTKQYKGLIEKKRKL